MTTLTRIGEDAKKLLQEMRAEKAFELLLSASKLINDTSTEHEIKLIDSYAFYALEIKESGISFEITEKERDFLDHALDEWEKLSHLLDEELRDLVSWLMEIDSLKIHPRKRPIMRNPNSNNPQCRLSDLKALLKKHLETEPNLSEWESTIPLLEKQLVYISGWKVFDGSTWQIWPTVKHGHYADYVRLILKMEEYEAKLSNLRRLLAKGEHLEIEREKISKKMWSYDIKSSSIGYEIERAVTNFRITTNGNLDE